MSASRTETLVPSLRITEIDLCAWIGQAAPREAIEYHRGFLVVDADPRVTSLCSTERHELSNVALRAWQCSQDGLVHLVQRRLGPNAFSYFAIKRLRPQPLPVALPSLRFREAA